MATDMPELLLLMPPHNVEMAPPPTANHVRVIAAADSLTILAYYVSSVVLESAAKGREFAGVSIEGKVARVETVPAARFSLPLTVAAELADLIIKNVATLGPNVTPVLEEFLASKARAPEEDEPT
jgi:hypothetical protein